MKLIAVALFVFCSSVNAASFYTGNDLLRFMQSGELTDRVLALGYVMGALDMGDRAHFCTATTQVTGGQARDIVKQYLEQNPSIRHEVADIILIGLFKRLWPCPARGTAM
jgi:hypothetical protein